MLKSRKKEFTLALKEKRQYKVKQKIKKRKIKKEKKERKSQRWRERV